MNKLILPGRHTPDDASIWREAIRRGWSTHRINQESDLPSYFGDDRLRYYGNTLHARQWADRCGIGFHPVWEDLLPKAAALGLTGRKIERIQFGSIVQPIEQDTFIKCTAEKWIPSRVYKKGETIDGGCKPDDWVLVQEPVRFTHEVRCFVLDGKLKTASYYRQSSEFKPQNLDDAGEISEMLQTQVDQVTPLGLPPGVVLDFGFIAHSADKLFPGRWALIEANEAWASGLYECDPRAAFDVICASQY